MSDLEFNAIFGGIIALIVAVVSLIGVVLNNSRSSKRVNENIVKKTEAIHHQTLNNGGDSMKDHVDSTRLTAEILNRKFDLAYKEFTSSVNDFRDSTNSQFGRLNEKMDRIETTVIAHHGGLL